MSEERLLVEERDEYGVIRVIESGDYRFLEFGDGVEQSCAVSYTHLTLPTTPYV